MFCGWVGRWECAGAVEAIGLIKLVLVYEAKHHQKSNQTLMKNPDIVAWFVIILVICKRWLKSRLGQCK